MFTFITWKEQLSDPNSDSTFRKSYQEKPGGQVDYRWEYLQERNVPSRQDSRQIGQLAFHNPAILLFSVLAAWLFSHGSHISSPGTRASQLQLHGFFCFLDTQIQKITTMKHQAGNIGFLKVKGWSELVALLQT